MPKPPKSARETAQRKPLVPDPVQHDQGAVKAGTSGASHVEAVLRIEISALRARLDSRTDEARRWQAEVAARDAMIVRLRAGEDPVSVYPNALTADSVLELDRAAPLRRAVEVFRADLTDHLSKLYDTRRELAERDRLIEDQRALHARTAIRLAEVETQYRQALDVIKEKGAAQVEAIESHGAAMARLEAVNALLDERTQALGQARAETAAALARLTDDRDHHATQTARVLHALDRVGGDIKGVGEGLEGRLSALVARIEADAALKDEIARQQYVIDALRDQLGDTKARLAEVNALYIQALDAVRERGEAQNAALRDRQALAEDLAATRALLATQERAALDARRDHQAAADAHARDMIADAVATIVARLERIETQKGEALRDVIESTGLLSAARLDLAERDHRIRELQARLESTCARLAEINTLYTQALETVRERGEAQTVAAALAEELAAARALLGAREEASRGEWHAGLRTVEATLSAFAGDTREALRAAADAAQARDARDIAAIAQEFGLLSAARLDLADRDRVVSELRAQLEATKLRLAEVNGSYLDALEVVRERGEGQAAALADRQGMAERLAAMEAVHARQVAELATVRAIADEAFVKLGRLQERRRAEQALRKAALATARRELSRLWKAADTAARLGDGGAGGNADAIEQLTADLTGACQVIAALVNAPRPDRAPADTATAPAPPALKADQAPP